MADTATYLREAREQRGQTLDDVAEMTRIPRHYLEMLEGEGDSRLISDRLYLVHYVRQYAAHLQVEQPEQLAAQFIRENNRLQSAQRNRTTQKGRKSPRIVPWLLLLVVLAGVGAAYVYEPNLLTRIMSEKVEEPPVSRVDPPTTQPGATPIENTGTAEPVPDNTPNTAVTVLQPEANQITPSNPGLVAMAPADGERAASSAADGATIAAPDRTVSATPGNSVPADAAGAPKSTTAAPVQAAADGQRLEIVAKEKSWVRVIVDDRQPQDMMLEPGDSRAWSAEKQFVLTFGNAGGVDLSLNGKKLPALGRSGQVIRNYQLPR